MQRVAKRIVIAAAIVLGLAVYICVMLICLLHGQGEPAVAQAPKFVIPQENLQIPEDLQACAANFRKIYAAINKYEKEEGTRPDWLSDLVPDYLSDEVLSCPNDARHKARYSPDPKLPCSYSWELSSARIPSGWDPTRRKSYRDWKHEQVELFGDVVPMVRCHHHGSQKVLNLSTGGQIYWGQLNWEYMFKPDYRFGDESPSQASQPEEPTTTEPTQVERPASPEKLDLSRTQTSDSDLARRLEGLTSLRELNLERTQITDAGLAHLKELTSLERLYLGNTQITDAGLVHLKNLTGLQNLCIHGAQVGDAGLAQLKGLTSLQSLCLHDTQVSDEGLAHLKSLAALSILQLINTQVSDAGLVHLKDLISLKRLHLGHTKITDRGLDHLKNLAALEFLCLHENEVGDAGLAHLKDLTSLQTLCLHDTQVSDAGLVALKDLASLRQLNLRGTKVTNAGLAELKRTLPNCRISGPSLPTAELAKDSLLDKSAPSPERSAEVAKLMGLEPGDAVTLELKDQEGDLVKCDQTVRMKVSNIPGMRGEMLLDTKVRLVSLVTSVSTDGIIESVRTAAVDSVRAWLDKADISDEIRNEVRKEGETFKVLYAKMQKDGSFVEFRELPPSTETSPMDAHAQFELFKLPRKPVRIGDTWSNTVDIANRVQMTGTFTLVGFEQVGDHACARIKGDITGIFHFAEAMDFELEEGKFAAVFALKEGMTVQRETKLKCGMTLPTGQRASLSIENQHQHSKQQLTPEELEKTKEEFKQVETAQSLLVKEGYESAKASFEQFVKQHPESVWRGGVEKLIQPIASERRVTAGRLKITGVVQDESGKQVDGVEISTLPSGGRTIRVDSEGKFEVSWQPRTLGTRPHEHYLVARHAERNLAAAVEIDEHTRTVDIKLMPGVILTGKVVDPQGKGIAGARIMTMLWGSTWGSSLRGGDARTDPEGKFEVRAIPPDHKYSVTASAERYGQDRVEVHSRDAVDNRLEVGQITLAVANLSVSGVVVDAEDQPVSGVLVYCSGEGQPSRRTQTDAEGKFTLKKVCAGRMRLSASLTGPPRLYGSVETEGGASDIKIVVGERLSVSSFVPREPPSLVGKPLPELEELKVELSPIDTEDKTILVCFWDMNQRPSRHCVRQLAKQAEQLEQKGVTVVAVQASKIEKDALAGWAQKYDIPFPIGMIEGNAEKIRFTWGVKSLPWLILTDAEHMVRAEGLSLTALKEKLAADN